MMKRGIFLSILLILLLGACGGGDEPTPADEPAQTNEEAVAEQEEVVEPTAVPPTATPEPEEPATLPPPVVVEDESAETDDQPTESEDSAETTESTDAEPMEEETGNKYDFGYGIQSHAIIGDPAYAMEVTANQLGLNWVKVQMRWADVQRAPDSADWGIWDSVINEANARNVSVMLSIVTAPEWSRAAGDQHGPPDDYGLYYEFLTDVLTRYPGQVHAIEVWNEQNLDREWRTAEGVAPANYVNFLQGAYDTIKGIDPNVVVISGALSPTGVHDPNKITIMDDFIWFDEALGLGILDYTDCVGVHHNGYNLPPDVGFDELDKVDSPDTYNFTGPWTDSHHSWSFKTTLDVMAEKARAVDPEMQLCVTEFGWASSEGYDQVPPTFEFALDNTLDEQAEYIVQAYQQMRDSGYVKMAFLFNLDFGNKGGGPTDDAVPYSIVDTNGVPRPAFSAISQMEK